MIVPNDAMKGSTAGTNGFIDLGNQRRMLLEDKNGVGALTYQQSTP